MKLDILREHGRRHWAKDQDRYKGIYRSDELDPEVWPDYQLMGQPGWWRDLIIEFGRHPLNRIIEHARILHSSADCLKYSAPGFVLPSVSTPTEEEIELTIELPSFSSLVEAYACLYEQGFLRQPQIAAKRGAAVAEKIQGLRSGNPQYDAVTQELQKQLGIDLGDPLAFAILDLALCSPSMISDRVAWSEFHPTVRLYHIIEEAKSLSVFRRPVLENELPNYVKTFQDTVCRRLNWRPASKNLRECKRSLLNLFGSKPPPGKQYDRLFVDRICKNLDAKIADPAFPIKLKPSDYIQPPVQILGSSLQLSLQPHERQYSFLCLTHCATKFVTQYLISSNETESIDEIASRQFFLLIHKFIRERFAPDFRDQVLRQLSSNYDDFVTQIENGAFY